MKTQAPDSAVIRLQPSSGNLETAAQRIGRVDNAESHPSNLRLAGDSGRRRERRKDHSTEKTETPNMPATKLCLEKSGATLARDAREITP